MDEKEKELRQKCERLRELDRLYGILVVSGMLMVLAGVLIFDNLTIALLGVIPSCIGMFIVAPKVRCPYCGSSIRMKFGLPSHCPWCKHPLS